MYLTSNCTYPSDKKLNVKLQLMSNIRQQNIIDTSINKWRKRLAANVCADGQHFKHFTVM